MAKIYAKASCVIVWLGKATPDSDQAIEDIRLAAVQSSNSTINKAAIFQLLEAAWFQRVWVLQEVAAARYILIKCGPAEIDGYAFCSGLSALDLPYETHPDLQPLISSVAYLVKGAVFRSRCTAGRSGRYSLDICPLGQLVDMYHTRKASDRRDKVYALLGMSSDDPSVAGLSANYDISWAQLFEKLINFIFDEVSVETWNDKEIAVIRGKGCVLGKVLSVNRDIDWQDRQHVGITWTNAFGYGEPDSLWTLQASAKSLQEGDVICLLQGATLPMVIRLCNDYWNIIMVAAPPLDDLQAAASDKKAELSQLITTFPHDFLLVWDWTMRPGKSQTREDYEHVISALAPNDSTNTFQNRLDKITRSWNSRVAWRVVEQYRAEKNLHGMLEVLATVWRDMGSPTLTDAYDGYQTEGEDTKKLKVTIDLLITGEGGWMPLWLAAEDGHETVAKLLLSTGKVDPDAEDENKRTPLMVAAENGHEKIVKLLISTGKVNLNATARLGIVTPLVCAAIFGHEAVVKLLLSASKTDLGVGWDGGINPRHVALSMAVMRRQEGTVNLLLGASKVDLNTEYGRGLLLSAEQSGNGAIIKLLLNAAKVEEDT
ncbi:hypothetical protein NW762_014400 [Fusarium torreyae]|uniref:Heterokaryon incompatibility domain-containing protein n=1 Tax=Fusarium torreyae TaxID=1237075 RepID=A0A9W8RJ32_9HYPO|nr:hypothetical protein NW762_014400 [Fusarium torreyae]